MEDVLKTLMVSPDNKARKKLKVVKKIVVKS